MPYIGKYSYLKSNYFVATGFNTWGMTGAMAASDILCDMIAGNKNEFSEIFNPQRCMLSFQLICNAFSAIKNLITPTAPRCSHMGCALKWNKYEKIWECPCHGSRFTDKGEILDNPANKSVAPTGEHNHYML